MKRDEMLTAVLLVLAVHIAGCADRRDDASAASAAMDAVYARFVQAYRLGEPDSVVALYTDQPLYLPGRGPVLEGRGALRSQFEFLETAKANGAVPHISFESVARGADGDLGWDVGYYTLEVERPDGTRSPPNRGKFTTVWQRGTDGSWRIHVDGFSPASDGS